MRTCILGAPVYIAELHPQNRMMCVAALYEYRPALVDMADERKIKNYALPNLPKRAPHELEGSEKADAKHFTTVAAFTPTGSHIITGTTKGWLNLISTSTREMIYSTRLCSKPILLIRLSASGRDLLVNASDTIIRTLKLPDLASPTLTPDNLNLEVEHKFQDVVNRLSWNHVAFSSSADYVMASTLMNHDIYIWERGHGSLVKILEGPKEELGAVEWHPTRPVVAATGVESGRVYLWGINTPQRWSALAPDFVEVEENVEYIEQEDEFDIHPIEELHRKRLDQEDEEVDVLTVDEEQMEREGLTNHSHSHTLTHADTNGNSGTMQQQTNGKDDFRMPVLLDMGESDSEDEIVAIGTGQYRRKSTAAREEEDFVDGDVDEAQEEVNGHAGTKRRRGE